MIGAVVVLRDYRLPLGYVVTESGCWEWIVCRNRICVRPDHLEPVTRRENVRRGIGPAAVHARKTHCPQGHPYSEANTYHFATGTRRRCKICAIRQAAEGKRRMRARKYTERGGVERGGAP